jgi:hypothetical protein
MTKEVSVREIMGDLLDIDPIVDVGTKKSPFYVVDSSWLIRAYEKSIGKDIGDDFDGYVEFSDKFVDEFTMTGNVEVTLERII